MMRNTHTAGYAPAQVVQKSLISREFYYWLGASQERYLHTVFPIDADFDAKGANVIVVQRTPEGEPIPLYVGRTGELSDHELQELKYGSGANELHIHLMAASDTAANKIAEDLSARHIHQNDQGPDLFNIPSQKSMPGIFFANVSF